MNEDDLKCMILSEILKNKTKDVNEGIFDFMRRRDETDPEEDRTRQDTIRNLGDNLGSRQTQLMDDYLKFVYASGLYDNPEDAEAVINTVRRNPDEVADVILHTLSQPGTKEYFAKIADASSNRNLDQAMRLGLMQLLKQAQRIDRDGGGDGSPPPSLNPDELNADDGGSRIPGDDSGGGGGAGAAGGKLPKDLPLSITKRQKETKPGEGQPAEVPLNSYLQKKLKLTPQSATKITKNIGSYLKSRGIPIAEAKIKQYLEEELVHNKAAFDKVRNELENINKKLEAGNLTTMQRKAIERAKVDATEKIKRMEGDLESQKGSIKGRKEGERAAYQGRKKEIEAAAKKHGTVGKIIYKYLARQGQKDQQFAKMFEKDPKSVDKMVKSVRNMLRRQLKRRGYDPNGPDMKKLQLEILEKMP